MCFSKLQKIAVAHDIKIYAEDFEYVPADFIEYVNFCCTEINKHFDEVFDFSKIEVQFVAVPESPAYTGKEKVAGLMYHVRYWFWQSKGTIFSLSGTDKNNQFWKDAEATAFLHELVLHWLSEIKFKGSNEDHSNKKLELLFTVINNKWRAYKNGS